MGILTRLKPALIALAIAAGALPARADINADAAFELSQAAIGNHVGDHVLNSMDGKALSLADFRGKPLVISLVFTSCSSVCPVGTEVLRAHVREAQDILGEDSFAILTFGFDARNDKPAQLAGFANSHRLTSMANWHLASADEATTAALLHDLGFSYESAAGGFDHITQTSVIDAEGRVYRQLYGEAYPLPLFIEPMKDLVLGRSTRSLAPADLWDRLAFICTVYDPATGAYRFDYSIFFGIVIGGVSLILTGIVILRLWLGNRRIDRAEPGHSKG